MQCNGKCHLAKQIAPDLDLSKNDVKGFTIVSNAFFPVFYQQPAEFTLSQFTFQKRKMIENKNNLYSQNFTKVLEQPPDFSL